VDLDDAQLARAALDDLRVAARDHGRDHAGLAEQHEALAVRTSKRLSSSPRSVYQIRRR